MKNNARLVLTENKINAFLLFSLFLSIYLQKFYIDIGFAFKPFMIVLGLIIYIYLIFNLKIAKKMYLFEKLFLLFFAYSLIRGYFSIDKIKYIRLAVVLIMGCIIYIFASNFIYKLKQITILKIIFYSSILFLLISLGIYVLGDSVDGIGGELDRGIYRLNGTIVDPNFFVLFATLIYGISLYRIRCKERKYYISFFLSIICILLTFSRGGILGIIFFTGLFIMKFKVVSLKSLIITVVIISIITLCFYFIIEKMEYDVNTIWKKRTSITTGSGRLQIWKNGMEILMQKPVFGIGLYNFQYYNKRFYRNSQEMHNTFLEVLVENGIVGATLFFIFIISFVFDKTKNEIEIIIKYIIYSQIFMLIFLSGIANEFIYLNFALYRGYKLKKEEICIKK